MQSKNNKFSPVWKIALRAVYSAILPLAFLFVCGIPSFSSLMFFMPALIVTAVLYLLPLYFSLAKIKSDTVKSIKPYILKDLLFSLLPAVAVCFFASLFIHLFVDGFALIWFFSPIIICTVVLVTLYFWLLYWFNNSLVKKVKKPVRKS